MPTGNSERRKPRKFACSRKGVIRLKHLEQAGRLGWVHLLGELTPVRRLAGHEGGFGSTCAVDRSLRGFEEVVIAVE